ncbi:carbohydrate-binding protein [Microaceticoccus formicicus]|uniref:carbohydrate-binding protein n=1 Tax=Microaceticoccus formicicus TaxID=3118105 RepID=UPI003CD00219|nr:carbohydrate-binding protein [Peptoniphilaceae bacterium AMB_02]
MRFEIVGKNLTFEEGKIGEVQKVKSLMLQTQTLSPPYDVVRGEFLVEGAELEGYINEGLTYEEIAELKLKALLEIDVTPLDAHQFANIEKQAINAISEVRNAREDVDVAKAEIKQETKNLVTLAKAEIEEAAKSTILEETEKVRKQLRNLVKIVDIPTDKLNDLIEIYDKWEESENVEVGEIRHYEGKLYEVIQAHTTQSDWTPNATPALWKEIAPEVTEDGEEIIPEFVQPTGAHDAYKLGDKVIFDGKVYKSKIDNNAYSPSAYSAGWERVIEQ